jgi:hypothetical protein
MKIAQTATRAHYVQVPLDSDQNDQKEGRGLYIRFDR